jgi:hypothetical protein
MKRFEGSTYLQTTKKELGVLEVISFPYRKNITLSLCKEGTSEPLAYFRSEEHAREFIKWMDGLTDLQTARE